MNRLSVLSAFFAACVFASTTPAWSAGSPKPLATPRLPTRPLHARLIVEVNRKGQVVRVPHGDLSGDRTFDLIVLGNAMQMWIRHPDGSAETGTYSVTYDYNPKTHDLTRHPAILSRGGTWANAPGAATNIVNDLMRQQQALEQYRALKAKNEAEKAKNLPDINAAVRRAMSKPSASPKP
ncbi:MAG TPA: hypothetical protein VGZ02_15830 [Candidatus Baltobacteraceae bacterium]|nr:hypothetical protein [Candidatus Baltobacteraceae bacterium]